MKKLMQYLLVAIFLIPMSPAQLKAEENTLNTVKSVNMKKNNNEKETLNRLNSIKLKTKSHLSKTERKALRDEVLSIRNSHTRPGGVIYISTGALILIIILLIILL